MVLKGLKMKIITLRMCHCYYSTQLAVLVIAKSIMHKFSHYFSRRQSHDISFNTIRATLSLYLAPAFYETREVNVLRFNLPMFPTTKFSHAICTVVFYCSHYRPALEEISLQMKTLDKHLQCMDYHKTLTIHGLSQDT